MDLSLLPTNTMCAQTLSFFVSKSAQPSHAHSSVRNSATSATNFKRSVLEELNGVQRVCSSPKRRHAHAQKPRSPGLRVSSKRNTPTCEYVLHICT